MKSLTKIALASVLAVAPVVAAVGTASANTELVPAARLAVPYWDVKSPRTTLLLLTNVSNWVDLDGADGAVHIEWYDKTCTRTNIPVYLTPGDIDQLDLTDPKWNVKGATNLPSEQGYADIDVRANNAGSNDASIQYNVLLGTVIISDSASDFALAYPAASGVGTASEVTNGQGGGLGDVIVTRDPSSTTSAALVWTGRYEAFPSRVFVPMFFAEGGPLSTQSLLAIAALPNGNWAGGVLGEAPGQDVKAPGDVAPTKLIVANSEFYDGCENRQSNPIEGHMILASLGTLYGSKANQTNWNTNATDENCHGTSNNFPTVDEASGAFVGWIDIPNAQDASIGDGNAGLVGVGVSDATDRGVVGVLVQNSGTQGDVTRLWGDPQAGGRDGNYSLVDYVDHCDIAQGASYSSCNTP